MAKGRSVASGTSYSGKGTDKANEGIGKVAGKGFFADEGKQITNLTGGSTETAEGIFTGDFGKVKHDAGNMAKSFGSALSAAPLRNALRGPESVYAGGSKEALEANRAQYDAGILAGQGQVGRGEGLAFAGADVAGQAAGMAQGTYGAAGGLYGTGTQLGASGIGSQNAALGASIASAGTQTGSLAEALARQTTQEQGQQMMGQAASARGGNQAAAIRGAQVQASQNALATNQQIGLMRLQEERARQDAITQAQQFAAGQYGNQAQLGYGTAEAGLGAQNAATGQVNAAGSTIGGIGGSVMGAGTTTQGQFLNAEVQQNTAQANADMEIQKAKSAHKAGLLKGLSSSVGSMFGG